MAPKSKMKKFQVVLLALFSSHNVNAAKTNPCFADKDELKGAVKDAVNQYVDDAFHRHEKTFDDWVAGANHDNYRECFADKDELKDAIREYVDDACCNVNIDDRECIKPDPPNCGRDSINQADYRGTISTTISGKTCQAWDTQSPHEHYLTPENFPVQGLEGGNYCRNPERFARAGCYTTDPYVEWEDCDVPSCTVAAAVDGSGCVIGQKYGWPMNTWCVSKITDMYMSDITDMWLVFNGASTFNEDLSSWNTSSVTDMGLMFSGAST